MLVQYCGTVTMSTIKIKIADMIICSNWQCHLVSTNKKLKEKLKIYKATSPEKKKKEKETRKTGSGAEEPYESKWFAFQSMMFLAEKNKPRRTKDNVEVSVNFLIICK